LAKAERVRKDRITIFINRLGFVYLVAIPGHVGAAMQDEAVITINGVKLNDTESMTVRVAVDTLANVLAEGLEEKEGQELTAVYMDSLVRIQALLESRETRKQ
jgi:predicted nucleotide-binding protein